VEPYDRAAKIVRALYNRRISGPPVLDLDRDFGFGTMFVQVWETIQDQALTVACRLQEVPRFHEIMPEQASISANDDRDWRMYILKA
jgi:aspartate beta-hydroxylase